MYSNMNPTALFSTSPNAQPMQMLLRIGNWGMLAGSTLLLVAIAASYIFAHLLPLPVQISAHISILVFATVIKLGYISRCVALNALPKEKNRDF